MKSGAYTTDFLVIGGGIIGLSVARELKSKFTDSRVTVIEKESDCGRHASGRNSGVLHAGFYYSPDSLKAKFTRLGNTLLTQYCETREIPVNKCGKLVVARRREDHAGLDELLKRGEAYGIPMHDVTAGEAKGIEPRVKTFERAIFSPTTSTVDPTKVMEAMQRDAQAEGVDVRCGVRYISRTRQGLRTSSGFYQAGYVVNSAGLYADTIARDFGFSENYRILPFKGLYLYSNEPIGAIRTNIYPVPDLRNPFLGVHVTVTADGRAKIGPTAIPALWREQYAGPANFRLSEFRDIIRRQVGLLLSSDWEFRRLAIEEVQKYSRRRLVALASALVEGVKDEQYRTWGPPGIRAQLLNVKSRRLEMDFVIQSDDRSMHILNAVSPAFTCAMPFATHVCDRINARLHGQQSTVSGLA